MPMRDIGKPNITKGLKTGFRAMSLTKAAPKKANVVGEIASNSKFPTLRGGKRAPSVSTIKRKKLY